MSIHSQHKLSELLSILQNILERIGDTPIVYWSQFSGVTFDNFIEQALSIIDGHLYFGGFHNNGSVFHDSDSYICDEDNFNICTIVSTQHKISELITILETIQKRECDLPVVYWDQFQTITFNDFTDQALYFANGYMYFGGFLRNGSHFHDDDPNAGNI